MHPAEPAFVLPRAAMQGRGLTVKLLVLSLIVLLPFQWLKLADAGGFALKLPYAVPLMAMAGVAVHPRLRAGLLGWFRESWPWFVPYLFYILLILPAYYGSIAQGSPVRQGFFAVGAAAFGAAVAMLRDPTATMRAAGFLGVAGFVLVTEFLGRQIDTSWAEAIGHFFGGDLNFVIYAFLRKVFNVAGDPDDNLAILASEKNAVSASLFVALAMFRAGTRQRLDLWGMAAMVPMLGLMVILNTRSVLLPLTLGLMLVGLIQMRQVPATDRPLRALLLVLAGVVAMGGLIALLNTDPLYGMLNARFSLGDASSASRVEQQAWAMAHIEEAILLGNGYMQIDEHPVHNLFLGAFLHGGILPFLLVVTFYLAVLVQWLRFLARIFLTPGFWHLPLRVEWVAMLPLLPLIRVWLVGDSGHPSLAEWTALALFFGFCAANRRAWLTAAIQANKGV